MRATQTGKITYFGLLLTITLGVAAGNLLSSGIKMAYFAWMAGEAVKEIRAGPMAPPAFVAPDPAAEAQREAARQARERETRQQRAKSPTGKKLLQACTDWTRAQQEHDTYTTRTERERHCKAYERYLASGRVPPRSPM